MKRHMKGKRIALLAGISTLCLTFPSFAGELVKDTAGTWYRNDDGSYLQNEWHQEENGNWYYFGKDGYAVTGVMQGEAAADGDGFPGLDLHRFVFIRFGIFIGRGIV